MNCITFLFFTPDMRYLTPISSKSEMYLVVKNPFRSRKFSFAEAEKALGGDDSRMVAVVLSELKRSGWLDVTVDAAHARKKLYRFTHPETMKEVAKMDVSKIDVAE